MNCRKWLGAAAFAALAAAPVHAEPTADYMLQQAAGVMHHSCDSLVEVTGGDEDAIIDVVKKMVAVSLINRQIDIAQYADTDEKMEALRIAFVEKLKAGCAADRASLLAGIVDAAVKDVLDL